MPDIDLDFPNRDIILSKIDHRAARLPNGKKHNTGIYVTEIPANPIDNIATIDHKTADERGYFKLDFLNVGIYKDVRDNDHLHELMNKEPEWTLLQYKDFTDLLFHVNGHSSLMQILKPSTVEQLAAALAIIRPAKRHLANESWETIMNQVWVKPANGDYYFKHSHAISYAVAVVVHMNLLCEQFSSSDA